VCGRDQQHTQRRAVNLTVSAADSAVWRSLKNRTTSVSPDLIVIYYVMMTTARHRQQSFRDAPSATAGHLLLIRQNGEAVC
jgi:hypothetical protein